MTKHLAYKPLRFQELKPRYLVANCEEYFGLNATAIALDNYVIVVDTLYYPNHARQFREEIVKRYDLPIKYVFITHHHGDHHFGISAFKNAEILGSNLLKENLRKRLEEAWTKEAFDTWREEEPEIRDIINDIEIIIPSIGFDERHVITDGDVSVEFIHSGGHTSCSSYAYIPKDQVLVTGDDLASGYWPHISDTAGNPDKWIQTYEHWISLGVETYIPGHGPITTNKHVHEHLEFMKKLKLTTIDAIKRGVDIDDLEFPEFPYKVAGDWQIRDAKKHLHSFYSKQIKA